MGSVLTKSKYYQSSLSAQVIILVLHWNISERFLFIISAYGRRFWRNKGRRWWEASIGRWTALNQRCWGLSFSIDLWITNLSLPVSLPSPFPRYPSHKDELCRSFTPLAFHQRLGDGVQPRPRSVTSAGQILQRFVYHTIFFRHFCKESFIFLHTGPPLSSPLSSRQTNAKSMGMNFELEVWIYGNIVYFLTYHLNLTYSNQVPKLTHL